MGQIVAQQAKIFNRRTSKELFKCMANRGNWDVGCSRFGVFFGLLWSNPKEQGVAEYAIAKNSVPS